MADPVNLEFIAEQLRRGLTEQTSMREELRDMRAELRELSAGQTVLTQMIFRVERDLVQVKDVLGRMDNRIARLEAPATEGSR